MSNNPFDWKSKPSAFVEDKKFNGVNQKKAENASKVLEVNREVSQIDLGKRIVTPYLSAAQVKPRKQKSK